MKSQLKTIEFVNSNRLTYYVLLGLKQVRFDLLLTQEEV